MTMCKVRELAEKEPENGVFRLLRSDVTRFLTTILIGTTYSPCIDLIIEKYHFFSIECFSCQYFVVCRVVNIGATALVTEAATAMFGEAGISAATGVMTVWFDFLAQMLKFYCFQDIKTCLKGLCIDLII